MRYVLILIVGLLLAACGGPEVQVKTLDDGRVVTCLASGDGLSCDWNGATP